MLLLVLLVSSYAAAQALPGQKIFETRCAQCHGTTGNGGEFGPAITDRIPMRSDDELTNLLHHGLPTAGMPAFAMLSDKDVADVIAYIRTLRPLANSQTNHVKLHLDSGQNALGTIKNQGSSDIQLLGDDGKIYLLRRSGDGYRDVTSQTDWTNFNGDTTGPRYSALKDINKSNVARLTPKWVFTMRLAKLEVTPVVAGGVMYVTTANECFALDAGSGRQIWHWRREPTKGVTGVSANGTNRGAAILGDRVFMSTDNAHLIALNRYTGALLWETPMAPAGSANYNSTGAPLVADNMVISGTAGGDDGARGFIAAYDPEDGKEIWRFWALPSAGEPGSETWGEHGAEHGGVSTWVTGMYDPELDTIYWPTGNPGPDMDGDARPGDNLYSDSVVALDPKTGKLKWYFQFTPHDIHDYDAAETLAPIDATWEGKPRKLLVQANRNGFFYVLDRTNGQFLLGKQYSKQVTWASGLTPQGKPIPVPGTEPTTGGNVICPWLLGASNFYSTSYNPGTGLYYVQTNDRCGEFKEVPAPWKAGELYMNGTFSVTSDKPSEKVLRAFDIHTGAAKWELPEKGMDVQTSGGVLTTAGGIVIFGDDSGAVAAADAATGTPLWSFQTSSLIAGSPMTYEFDNKQYIAIAAGANIIAFALPRISSQ